MLETLKNHHDDYRKANFANDGGVDYASVPHASNRYPGSARFSVWLDSAVTQWAPYYSEQTMTDLMCGFASQYHNKKRQDLLSGWVSKESNREHWGSLQVGGNYRMVMGAADSRGSFGFHQIQARYLYGKDVGGRNSKASGVTNRSKCSAFANDNTYKPASAVTAVTKWSIGSGCGGSMRQANKADETSDYAKKYINILSDINLRKAGYQIKIGSEYFNRNVLREGEFLELPNSYERLIKGIAGYNQGANFRIWSLYSIPEALLELESNISSNQFGCITSGSAETQGYQKQFCNGLAYAINVRKKEGLPLVKYVYKYEFSDFNSVTNAETGLLEQGPSITKYACFEYGEAAWLANNEWETLRDTQMNEIKCAGKALSACTNQVESLAYATLLGGS
jgi:hypothetical protein